MFTCQLFRKYLLNGNTTLLRHKHKPDHWSVLRKKNFPVDKALEHFDDFYYQVFSAQWPPIREALLGKQKYVAIVNNLSDTDRIIPDLERCGAINVRRLFSLEKQYLMEKLMENRRVSKLKKIWKMDKQMKGNPVISKDKDIENHSPKTHSLKEALESADYDFDRIVDSKNISSTSVLQEFIPASKLKGKEDYIPESSQYKFYDRKAEFLVEIQNEYDFHFPECLNVYCFEEGNESDFEPARRGSTGVLDYYLMDGASLLPVLALDLKPGVKILDMCAAPGGKALLALQTFYPACVTCNDVSSSRVKRIYNVLNQFLYDLKEKWIDKGLIEVTNSDGRFFSKDNFDRILVDVPCTTDRHSLKENDNNIFKSSRVKERLQLPELQCELLVHAMKLVNVRGIVVYSTCSLSPIQNDGVVHMALKKIWAETKMIFIVKNLSPALLQTCNVFKLASPKLMKYGHLVTPHLDQNYGPMYFCKLQRIK